MKKTLLCFFLIGIMLFSACGGNATDASNKNLSELNIYCLGISGQQRKPRQLVAKPHLVDFSLPSQQLVESILKEMKEIDDYDCVSALPEDVSVEAVIFYGNSVVVNLSKEYYNLLDVQKSLLASAIAMTLTQIDSINFVKVSCVAQEHDSADDLYLSADNVVMDTGSIQFNTFDVTLYLLNRETEEIQSVSRVIKTEEEQLTPELVFQELSRQSDVDKLQSPVPQGYLMRSITVTDGICVVNFIDIPEVSKQLDGLSVRAITNTLCSLQGVRGVLIRIDNIPLSHYGLRGYDGVLSFDKEATK